MDNQGLAIGTRFWGKSVEDLRRLRIWTDAALKNSDSVFIAVNIAEDTMDTPAYIKANFGERVTVIPVSPWGFSFALNALIMYAVNAGNVHMLSASVEFPPHAGDINILTRYMRAEVLSVGAALADHDYQPGKVLETPTAQQVPWNTYNLLNLELMKVFGVPLIGDYPGNRNLVGAEEMVTLAIFQKMFGYGKAILTKVPGVSTWEEGLTKDWSEERWAAHLRKMGSKEHRANAQISEATQQSPTVQHI